MTGRELLMASAVDLLIGDPRLLPHPVRMMGGAESFRDVFAFPKTQRAQCLLTQAPSSVDERQLRELHIRVRTQEARS